MRGGSERRFLAGKFVARCTLRVVFSHRSTERDSAACKSVDISTAIGLETRTEPESRTTTSISWAECQCTELGSESVHSARAHRVTRAETLRGTARASKLTCSCLLELLPVRTNRPASGPASHEASTRSPSAPAYRCVQRHVVYVSVTVVVALSFLQHRSSFGAS